jgi:hypothetical protein
LSAAQPGEAAQIGDEIVGIVSVGAGEVEVIRGCVDTIPKAHAAGTRVWFFEGLTGSDERDYTLGEEVEVRLLTATQSQRLALDDATGSTVEITARQARPYPPGDVKVNGVPFASLVDAQAGEIELTWAHRNRITQDDALVAHEEGSITPEAGTTYNVRVFDDTTLVRSTTGITAVTWTYTSSMQTADGEPADTGWWFEVESERAGLVSHQAYRFFMPRRQSVIVTGSAGLLAVAGNVGTSAPRAVRVTGNAGSLIVES